MKKKSQYFATIVVFVIFIVFALGSASTPPAQNTNSSGQTQNQVQPQSPTQQQQNFQQAPAQQAQTPTTTQAPHQQQNHPASPFWTGSGGRGMTLGILTPQGQGLSENLAYLPAMIQSVLISNISQYSAISVLNRISFDRVIAENFDQISEDDLDIIRLGQVAQVGHILSGSITQSPTGFSLSFNVTDITPARTIIASFSGTCTATELDDHSAIQRASIELLSQMNVQLSARARNELGRAGNPETISAQVALSRGVTAERNGLEIAALSYYLQATELDPGLEEAVNRLRNVSASVTGGNMSGGVQNDMQWRNQWIERLRETEEFLVQFLRESPAFYIVYGASADQWHIDYVGSTINLGVDFSVLPEPQWFEAKNRLTTTIRNGLLATERAENWRLNWPANTITRPSPFSDASNTYAVVAEILNASGTVIARQTVNMRFGWFIHNGMEQLGTVMPYIHFGTRVLFTGVDQNAITGNLSIRICTINGAPAANASQLGIRALPDHEYNNLPSIRSNSMQIDNLRQYTITFNGNRNLLRYNGNNTSIDIPWGVTVLSEGSNGSNLRNRELISVTIPSSVFIIGNHTLSQNRLTSIILPESVRSFGQISDNQLTSIGIGSNVNLLYGITGSNWTYDVMGGQGSGIEHGFNNAYRNNNNRAGIYTRPNTSSGIWTYRGQ